MDGIVAGRYRLRGWITGVVGVWKGGFWRGGFRDDGVGGVRGRLWMWGLMGWEGRGGGVVKCPVE